MEEPDVSSETENSSEELRPLKCVRETQREEEEERDYEEDNDAEMFSAWMARYRAGDAEERQAEEKEVVEEEEEEEEAGGDAKSHKLPVTLPDPPELAHLTPAHLSPANLTLTDLTPAHLTKRRRPSLPCPVSLSALQFHLLHSAAQPPVTAKVLLHRASSRGLLLSSSPESASPPRAERRSSIVSSVPEEAQGKKTPFRRRNVMSMSDADSLCLICHNDFSTRDSGIQELQCSHTFHKQCIDEWLWSKPSCPTCQIHVSTLQPSCCNTTGIQPLTPPTTNPLH